ncbi:hypothetical protein QJQ45_024040, partial [Haematococcus lacustris]
MRRSYISNAPQMEECYSHKRMLVQSASSLQWMLLGPASMLCPAPPLPALHCPSLPGPAPPPFSPAPPQPSPAPPQPILTECSTVHEQQQQQQAVVYEQQCKDSSSSGWAAVAGCRCVAAAGCRCVAVQVAAGCRCASVHEQQQQQAGVHVAAVHQQQQQQDV